MARSFIGFLSNRSVRHGPRWRGRVDTEEVNVSLPGERISAYSRCASVGATRGPHDGTLRITLALLAGAVALGGSAGLARGMGGTESSMRSAAAPLYNLPLLGVACPDALTCLALGTRVAHNERSAALVILASHDGGVRWSAVRRVPGLANGLVSCPSPRQCFVAGGPPFGNNASAQVSLLHTADGGASWKLARVGPTRALAPAPIAMTCPSPSVCYVAEILYRAVQAGTGAPFRDVMMATRNGGKTWTDLPLPAHQSVQVRAIACRSVSSCQWTGVTSAKTCYQAGAIFRTDDGGKTWSRRFGDCATGIAALTCATAQACYAAGWYGSPDAYGDRLVLHSDDGGVTWNDEFESPIPRTDDLNGSFSPPITGIACPDAQACYMPAGATVIATIDGGATWTVRTTTRSGTLVGISCATSQVCVAVGSSFGSNSGSGPPTTTGLILRTTDSGKTWKQE